MNVMITGAAGGLGRAMAVECARRGYHLFLTDLDEQALLCIKAGLERRFRTTVVAKACDLTDGGSVDAMLCFLDRNGLKFCSTLQARILKAVSSAANGKRSFKS